MVDDTLDKMPSILCVDDEPSILSSLRRLFRTHGYHIFTAESGAAGLQLLESEPVDLIISDMRMPEMDGAQFLERVRERWPDTVRILLTGYSDIQSILDAINRGEIFRYITKPWDDNDIVLVVRHALERKALEQEKRRLEELAQRQNEELKELNASLERKVEERTAELKVAHDSLVSANDKLKTNFLTSIKVFSGMIEMRSEHLAGHSRRVADLARKIAIKMDQDSRDTQEIFISGLLHNIGKIAFSDELLSTPLNMMNGETLGIYRKHPIRGEQLLMPLENLRGAAKIIRSQQERFDGHGFPDGISGLVIPMGARILAIASDYYNLQIGIMIQRRLPAEEATAVILKSRGTRYDPVVLSAFESVITGKADNIEVALPETLVSTRQLLPGMTIARDLVTQDGVLLLSVEHVLNERLIQQILDFEASADAPIMVYVRSERRK